MVPLSPDIAQTIRSSCKPLLEREVRFRQEFHSSLMELMPEVPVMQVPAGEQISQSLMDCVLWAVFAEETPAVIGGTLQGIGLEAYRLGFPREGYQSVGHALLRSLREVYPSDWTGMLSSSWIGYHSWLCDHWLRGADLGIAEDRARPIVQTAPVHQSEQRPVDVEEDEDDEGLSYNEIMVSMTLGSSRTPRRRDDPRPDGRR